MSDRLERLEAKVADLDERLTRIAETLQSLLAPGTGPEAAAASVPEAEPAVEVGAEAGASTRTIGADVEDLIARHGLVVLAGLSSMVLAGAVVLRIITLASPVPLTVGASIGLAYCLALMVLADGMIRRGRLLYGDTFATLSVLILGSLLVEVAHLPHGFRREVAYALLAAVFALYSFGAIKRRRVWPFSIGLLAAPLAGLAIGGSPFHHPLFASIVVVSVLASQFGMGRNRWEAPRLIPGIVSFLYLLALVFLGAAAARRDLPQHALAAPGYALGILGAFFLLYVASAARVALFRPRRLDAFEASMAIVMSLVVYAGAAAVTTASPTGAVLCGAVGGFAAILFYVVAGISFVRHGEESASFYPLTAIAFLYAMASFALLLGFGPRLGLAYQGLALALALFASRYGKRSISFQAHALSFAAFGVLAATAIRALPPEAGAASPGPAGYWLLATGALAVASFGRLRRFRDTGSAESERPPLAGRVALVLVLAAGAGELLAGATEFVFPAVKRVLRAESEPQALGLWLTIQTLLVILGALGVLCVSVRLRMVGPLALAVAMMGLAGLKLFAVDAFRVSGPYLVCSTFVFGIALILSSVLYRRFRGIGAAEPPAPGQPEVTT